MAINLKQVYLGPNGIVHSALRDWLHLLLDMKRRPSHVNELVLQQVSDIGNMDASGRGAGGVWMSTTGSYPNTVWRLQWPPEVKRLIVSNSNPHGTISNSDLEMAAILLQWLAREALGSIRHQYNGVLQRQHSKSGVGNENVPEFQISARLVRALALR